MRRCGSETCRLAPHASPSVRQNDNAVTLPCCGAAQSDAAQHPILAIGLRNQLSNHQCSTVTTNPAATSRAFLKVLYHSPAIGSASHESGDDKRNADLDRSDAGVGMVNVRAPTMTTASPDSTTARDSRIVVTTGPRAIGRLEGWFASLRHPYKSLGVVGLTKSGLSPSALADSAINKRRYDGTVARRARVSPTTRSANFGSRTCTDACIGCPLSSW
jgi:hypothetical protein